MSMPASNFCHCLFPFVLTSFLVFSIASDVFVSYTGLMQKQIINQSNMSPCKGTMTSFSFFNEGGHINEVRHFSLDVLSCCLVSGHKLYYFR
jgi:hypothetical protein